MGVAGHHSDRPVPWSSPCGVEAWWWSPRGRSAGRVWASTAGSATATDGPRDHNLEPNVVIEKGEVDPFSPCYLLTERIEYVYSACRSTVCWVWLPEVHKRVEDERAALFGRPAPLLGRPPRPAPAAPTLIPVGGQATR